MPNLSALLALGLAMIGGLAMSRLMKLLHLPNVTGYIVTGIVMGPFVFGLFFNGFTYDGITGEMQWTKEGACDKVLNVVKIQ